MTSPEPIAHIPPLPRIDINPRVPITQPEAKTYLELEYEIAEERLRAAKADKIWKLLRQVAEGTNMPTIAAE